MIDNRAYTRLCAIPVLGTFYESFEIVGWRKMCRHVRLVHNRSDLGLFEKSLEPSRSVYLPLSPHIQMDDDVIECAV